MAWVFWHWHWTRKLNRLLLAEPPHLLLRISCHDQWSSSWYPIYFLSSKYHMVRVTLFVWICLCNDAGFITDGNRAFYCDATPTERRRHITRSRIPWGELKKSRTRHHNWHLYIPRYLTLSLRSSSPFFACRSVCWRGLLFLVSVPRVEEIIKKCCARMQFKLLEEYIRCIIRTRNSVDVIPVLSKMSQTCRYVCDIDFDPILFSLLKKCMHSCCLTF